MAVPASSPASAPALNRAGPDHPRWAERSAAGLGVYVHVPFCAHRCGYCDFAAFEGMERLFADYVDAVIAEIRARVDTEADTLFVGGGTPSLLEPVDLGRLIASVPLSSGAEVTVEMNPESTSQPVLDAALVAGATRISLGMQSALPHVLGFLERRHSHGVVEDAVGRVRTAGFVHLNLDLIYGTPGESERDWIETLDAAMALGPDHISAYALGIESGTPLGIAVSRGVKPEPEADVLAERLAVTVEVLRRAGYVRYEISNWAREMPCLHNLRYWSLGRYVGVGNGAHSYHPAGGVRSWNHRHPTTYVAAMRERGEAREGSEVVEGETALFERLILGLRRSCGLVVSAGQAERVPGKLVSGGFVDVVSTPKSGRITLTDRGMAVANSVVIELSLAMGEC